MIKLLPHISLSLMLIMVLASNTHAAKLYKWVDEKGVTHYGETPPDLDTATRLNIKTGASSDQAKAVEKLEASRKAKMETNDAPTTNEEVEAKNREIIQRNCEIQKRNLGQLTANRRIKETAENGEVRYLTEEDIMARKKEIQKYISENCTGTQPAN